MASLFVITLGSRCLCIYTQPVFYILIGTDAARKARGLAEAAFFQPSIMSLLYFPAEHQLAIYTVHTHNAQSLTADERNIYVFPQNKLLREQIAVLGRSFLDLLIEFVVWIPV